MWLLFVFLALASASCNQPAQYHFSLCNVTYPFSCCFGTGKALVAQSDIDFTEASVAGENHPGPWSQGCYEALTRINCAVGFSPCIPGVSPVKIRPCRPICEYVKPLCFPYFQMDCSGFPLVNCSDPGISFFR